MIWFLATIFLLLIAALIITRIQMRKDIKPSKRFYYEEPMPWMDEDKK